MSDVLEIARARRDALKTEICHLDAFIRMGEKLVRDIGSSHSRPLSRPLDMQEKLRQAVSRPVAAE